MNRYGAFHEVYKASMSGRKKAAIFMHIKGVSWCYYSLCQFPVLLSVVVHKEACFFVPFHVTQVFSAYDVQAKSFDCVMTFENF